MPSKFCNEETVAIVHVREEAAAMRESPEAGQAHFQICVLKVKIGAGAKEAL